MVGRLARYLGGAVAAWVTFTVQGLLVYLGLLGYASITGGDVGGPLAGPFAVLLAALLGAVLVPILYVPALLCLEALRPRTDLVRRTLGTAAVVAAIVAGVVAVAALFTETSLRDGLIAWLVGLALLVLPALAATIVVSGASALTKKLRYGGGRVPDGHRPH